MWWLITDDQPYDKDKTLVNQGGFDYHQRSEHPGDSWNPFSGVMMIFKGTIAMISKGIDQILERLTKVSQIQCDLNVASLRAEIKQFVINW